MTMIKHVLNLKCKHQIFIRFETREKLSRIRLENIRKGGENEINVKSTLVESIRIYVKRNVLST